MEYLLADQLGSVRVITDAVGAIVGSASFGVFGAAEAASGVASAFGFTGAWTDDETGLVYLRARDYDPATGQFLQVDPAVDDTRQPYAYAYNNPLLWTDPTGLDVWGDIGNGVLGFAAGVLDDLTFGASSAILGAVVPGYDCWTQTNPWFGVGQTVSMVVSTALLVVSGVGAAFAIAKVVATIGVKAAVKLAAATIKATVRNTLQSAKSVLAAGGSSVAEAVRTAKKLLADDTGEISWGILFGGKAPDSAPSVNWGQQEKHFMGHPNFIAGRSPLTADPRALVERAGTGTPLNKAPHGTPGFRERVDFGEMIGLYSHPETGELLATTVGILHYGKSGIHIVPGRPIG